MSEKLEWHPHPDWDQCWTAATQRGYPEWAVDVTATHWENDKPVDNIQYVVKHGGHGLAYRDTAAEAKSLAQNIQNLLPSSAPTPETEN